MNYKLKYPFVTTSISPSDADDYLMTNICSLNGGYTYSAIPHMIYHIKRQVNPVSKCLFNLLS